MTAQHQVPSTYLDMLQANGCLESDRMVRAFTAVKRHRFLECWYRLEISDLQATYQRVVFNRDAPSKAHLEEIYSNQALITMHDDLVPTSSTSQPVLVAKMLQYLDVRPGMRVLEIGTGTGYNAALLAQLVGEAGHVVTMEYQQSIAEQARGFLEEEGYGDVSVVYGDGFKGAEQGAPYDRIIATVGCSDISPHWLEQLADDGLMLVPLEHGFTHPLVRLTKHPDHPDCAVGEIVDRSGFMKIQGHLEWGNPWMSYRLQPMPTDPVWQRPLPDDLELPDMEAHPFQAPSHQRFRFYLALCSRELWFDNSGYGLADPASKAIVKFTRCGVEAYSASDDQPAIERLYERLQSVFESWTALGSPAQSDFRLRLTPKAAAAPPSTAPLKEWTIVRPCFLETIQLA